MVWECDGRQVTVGNVEHAGLVLHAEEAVTGQVVDDVEWDKLNPVNSHNRWPEFKTLGPHLRSQEMKLPSNIGQKKLSNIERVVTTRKIVSIGLEYPHAYEEIVKQYNDFRSHIVLLRDLKTALHNTELELDQLAAQMPANKLSECPIIEPRFRVSSTFYEELEQSPVRVLNTPMTEGGKGKGKGKQQQKPAPVTGRAITKLIEVNLKPIK
ncbi:hypothetical protein niasHT_035857 [Heterodera trifolii]|uniref:DNA methyltransferase 1-associated 1 domain-containing protein n=1 Tax=Heterodera trifolii TaxID=157864 RepID=A0ABD2ICM4_9BILA